jgi:hypothetical protein
MVNNYRKANNIAVTLGLNLETQGMFDALPPELKIHVVRYVLIELRLVGQGDRIFSTKKSPAWAYTYKKFVTEPGYATLGNFNKLLKEIVEGEYQYANVTNGPYKKERELYGKFIEAIRRINLNKLPPSAASLEHSNSVLPASAAQGSVHSNTLTMPLLNKVNSSVASSSSIKGGWFSGGAGGRRRRGTKRARRTRRRSSRKN